MSNTTTHSRAGRMARGNSTATHESTLSQSEADPENHTSIPEQPEPREVEAPAPTFSEQVTTVRMGAHYAGLVPMAMFGVLIRLGLEALATCECLGWIIRERRIMVRCLTDVCLGLDRHR